MKKSYKIYLYKCFDCNENIKNSIEYNKTEPIIDPLVENTFCPKCNSVPTFIGSGLESIEN